MILRQLLVSITAYNSFLDINLYIITLFIKSFESLIVEHLQHFRVTRSWKHMTISRWVELMNTLNNVNAWQW